MPPRGIPVALADNAVALHAGHECPAYRRRRAPLAPKGPPTMTRYLLALALACALVAPSRAANLVANPGFESMSATEMPENWASRSWTIGTKASAKGQLGGASGTRSLLMEMAAGKGV